MWVHLKQKAAQKKSLLRFCWLPALRRWKAQCRKVPGRAAPCLGLEIRSHTSWLQLRKNSKANMSSIGTKWIHSFSLIPRFCFIHFHLSFLCFATCQYLGFGSCTNLALEMLSRKVSGTKCKTCKQGDIAFSDSLKFSKSTRVKASGIDFAPLLSVVCLHMFFCNGNELENWQKALLPKLRMHVLHHVRSPKAALFPSIFLSANVVKAGASTSSRLLLADSNVNRSASTWHIPQSWRWKIEEITKWIKWVIMQYNLSICIYKHT